MYQSYNSNGYMYVYTNLTILMDMYIYICTSLTILKGMSVCTSLTVLIGMCAPVLQFKHVCMYQLYNSNGYVGTSLKL